MIEHPYTELSGGRWLAGNLHAHTTASDGQRDHQAVIDDYAGRGHGFLMISDHDILTDAEDYADFDPHGMILVPGNEITANGPHMLHVGASGLVEPDAERQRVIDGVKENDFTMVFGFPGRTSQYLTSKAVENYIAKLLPARIEMRKNSLRHIDAAMAMDEATYIKYASKQSRISNAYKKWKWGFYI